MNPALCLTVTTFFLKAQYHLLISRLRNNIITMYFDRYLPSFEIKIQIILVNL